MRCSLRISTDADVQIPAGKYETWDSVTGHLWRVYEHAEPQAWLGGFAVSTDHLDSPQNMLFGMSSAVGAGSAPGGLHKAAALLRESGIVLPPDAEEVVVIL